MRALENTIVEVYLALEPAPEVSTRFMSEYVDDIPESAKPAIRKKLGEIRDAVRAIKSRYGLPADAGSRRRHLCARLSVSAADLAECDARRLGSLGEVPNGERDAISRTISELEEKLGDLNRLIRGPD